MAEFSINTSIPKIGGFDTFKPSEFNKISSAAGNMAADNSKSGESFLDMVDKSLKEIEGTQEEANTAVKDLATGKNKNLHEVMMTLEKADLSLKLGMQIRNKVIDAYKEIMRMQV